MVCGLYFIDPNNEWSRIGVPLLSVQATATFYDISARVTIIQDYQAEKDYGTVSANYTFPLPARANVGGDGTFKLTRGSGRVLIGNIEEVNKAKKDYDAAVEKGQTAALMEQSTPDVFNMSVGNIMPGEKIQIEFSFVTELEEDEEPDSLRFKLPTYISLRYGAPPCIPRNSLNHKYFSFSTNIQTIAPISRISSPSHTINTELGPDPTLPNAKDLPFSNYAKVSLMSDKPLDKDLLIVFKFAGSDMPRGIAEIHPSAEHDSLAVLFTFVPRFKVPDIPSQEFVFLVDRSGSMGGTRIETAKQALVILLRSLPAKGTVFNIVSFGSRHDSLWSTSQPYDQKRLDEATKHVDKMDANYGGTEINTALETTFKKRSKTRPTSVFVLTDGDSWNLETVLETVTSNVTNASAENFLRVFTLGIGASSSTAMVEGIARVANGASQFVTDGEAFTGKIARLLKAAKSPPIRNIRISYGLDQAPGVDNKLSEKGQIFDDVSTIAETEDLVEKSKKLSLFDEEVDASNELPKTIPLATAVTLPPTKPIQQSPETITKIFPSIRFYVYAILSSPVWKKGDSIPEKVTLTGDVLTGETVELSIPLVLSQTDLEANLPAPVHTIAAKKLIQDLEDRKHCSDDQAVLSGQILRLGMRYSIASSETSFIAIDPEEQKVKPIKVALVEPVPAKVYCRSASKTPRALNAFGGGMKKSRVLFGGGPPPPPPAPMAPYPAQPMSFSVASSRTLSSAPGGAPMFDSSYAAPPPPARNIAAMVGASHGAPPPPLNTSKSESSTKKELRQQSSSLKGVDLLELLAREQQFDGSFTKKALKHICSKSLKELMELDEVKGVSLESNKAEVVVTVLALEFLKQKNLGDDKAAWMDMYDKGTEFCVDSLGDEAAFEQLKGHLGQYVVK